MKFKIYKANTLAIKGILAFLALVIVSQISAQSINTTVASNINNVFSPLEKNRVPYNILLDYGIEFIDISKYDGVLRTDNYTSISMYKDMYSSLVSSATATGVSGMASPVLENEEWQTLQQQQNNNYKGSTTAPLILSGLYYNYSKIRSDALSTNKIQVVNGKYDDKYISGVWQNPYESKIGFAITAPVQDINQHTVIVSLPATLWHTNETITNIAVDFGNGNGYKTLNNGVTASETYTSIGLYTWTYRVQLSNGQYKYCRQNVNITKASTGSQARSSGCGNVQTLPPIIATRAYLGVFGSATVQIAYGSNDCKLRKPLIVAEGLDTGFFAPSGRIGDTDYDTFDQSIIESGSNELWNLTTRLTTSSLDYDIVYVNWDNGTDYLQRNAYVLQAVINYVNQQKAINGSTEPNVVLGQSMGGLIARYALRDMENRSETHDTSLYISHDAPHQGANAPLGFLYMARHAVDQFIRTPLGNIDIPISSGNVGLGSVEDLLDAPGVKQMLINNVSSSFTLDNALHTSWQNELKTMGYPQQTRNVALSNASHCAELQDVTAGDRIFTLDAFGKTSFLTDIALSVTGLGAVTGILTSVVFDEAGFLLGILPGSSRFDVDFWVNAYPSSGTAQIYYGSMKYRKTFLWLVPINVTITQRSYNSPSGTLPIDSYPGGVNPSFEDIDINNYKSGLLGKYGFTVDLNPNFGFIPAASALDVGSNNTTLNSTDYLKVYTKANPPTGSKAIPFDNFITSFNTSSINEPHISFNRTNGDWLAEELDSDSNTDTFDCSFICENTKISGNASICTSGTYSLSGGAPFYNWSIIEGSYLVNLSGNGTPNITITKSGSASGYVTMQVTLGDNSTTCGNVTLTKRIFVGTQVINSVFFENGIYEEGYFCSSHTGNQYEILPKISGNTYQYRLLGYPSLNVLYTSSILSGNTGTIYYTPSPGWYVFEARTSNSCGTSDWFGSEVEYVDCSNSGGGGEEGEYRFAVYPNPSYETINISTKVKENISKLNIESDKVTRLRLYDFSGNVIIEKNKGSLKRINISSAKEGLYFLEIVSEDIKEIHKVSIKK